MPTREIGISSSELIMKSPIRTTRECMGAMEYNGQSIVEGHKRIQTNADGAGTPGAEGELRFSGRESPPASCGPDRNRSLARPASFSPALHDVGDQPTSNRTDADTHSGSLLELQSVVITNGRSHERELKDSVSTPRANGSNEKRGRSEISQDDGNDDAGDLDDADYASESSVSSRRIKEQARRPVDVHLDVPNRTNILGATHHVPWSPKKCSLSLLWIKVARSA